MVGGFYGMLLLSAKIFQDFLFDEKTLFERQFGMAFDGPVNCLEQWSNITLFLRKTYRDCINFGPKVLPGIFLGYVLHAGGIWKGDITVADIEEVEEMDASEIHARRLNAKEVLTPQRSGNFIFPVADGTVKIFGRGQRLRTSTLNRERPER